MPKKSSKKKHTVEKRLTRSTSKKSPPLPSTSSPVPLPPSPSPPPVSSISSTSSSSSELPSLLPFSSYLTFSTQTRMSYAPATCLTPAEIAQLQGHADGWILTPESDQDESFKAAVLALDISDAGQITVDVADVDFSFKGYEPGHTLKALQAIEPRMAELGKDAKVIIEFCAARGVKPTTVARTLDAGPAATIRALVAKYNIVERRPLNESEVTISRVVSVFPQVMAAMMSKPKSRVVGLPLPGVFKKIAFPAAGSFLVLTMWGPINLWRAWNFVFGVVIGSVTRRNTDFQDVVLHSTWISNENRVKCCRKLGISADAFAALEEAEKKELFSVFGSYFPKAYGTVEQFWAAIADTRPLPNPNKVEK